MAWHDHVAYQPVIEGDVSSIRPLGDFVLVRPLSDEEGGKLTGTGLAELSSLSEFHMTADYRYRWNRPKGNRYGEVVACGEGDLMVFMECDTCKSVTVRIAYKDASSLRKRCDCGGTRRTATIFEHYADVTHAEMFVHPGDIVVYPQVPANEIEINGEKLVFLHQEQHVLAVIEPEFVTDTQDLVDIINARPRHHSDLEPFMEEVKFS